MIPNKDSYIHIIQDTYPLTPTTNFIHPDTKPPYSAPITHLPPQVRPVDKPISDKPLSKTVTVNEMRKGFGFQRVEKITPHLKICFKDNFHLSSINRAPILTIGEIATLDKKIISRKTVKLPSSLRDIMHADIEYGCQSSIRGAKYELFVVDQATCHKYV